MYVFNAALFSTPFFIVQIMRACILEAREVLDGQPKVLLTAGEVSLNMDTLQVRQLCSTVNIHFSPYNNACVMYNYI